MIIKITDTTLIFIGLEAVLMWLVSIDMCNGRVLPSIDALVAVGIVTIINLIVSVLIGCVLKRVKIEFVQ